MKRKNFVKENYTARMRNENCGFGMTEWDGDRKEKK